MEDLIPHVLAFIVGVLSSLAAVLLLNYRILFRLLPQKTVKGYLLDLQEKIKEMPFIYKDLEAEVINDFVDVEFQTLDLVNLRLMPTTRIDLAENEKLKRNARVLFLGSAGLGKTTFQRHTIITLINQRDQVKFINDKERPIAIYLPLKAVDNSDPFPVVRYILKYNPLFSHRGGTRRLVRLARKRRLFLFLDGYDEIPFAEGNRNFVQEELTLMLFPYSFEQSMELARMGLGDFYHALDGCRIWLSSRKEFFEQNPVGHLGSGERILSGGLTAVELRGIGNNRIKLAKNIFDKYRKWAKRYHEILSEEYFLFEIDSSNDEEIKKLSYNPLFLTVMCYIYAQRAIEEEDYKVSWANKFEDLIVECIELLLRDLDEVKARDLPKAHKAGLLKRRNAFQQEKEDFLQYFASQLFFEGKSVFTLEYLKLKIRDFFQSGYSSESATTIVQSLDQDRASQPNFALQLMYCGIFVIVDKNYGNVFYDFPHRRFREVLASIYIATPERYEQLLANIEKKQFSEFLHVFFNSTRFNDYKFQDDSLVYILEKSKHHLEDDSYRYITSNFMQRKPKDYNPSRIIRSFLLESLYSKDTKFQLSLEVLRNFSPGSEFLSKLPTVFLNSLQEKASYCLSLCCALLEFHNIALLEELLRTHIPANAHNSPCFPVLLQYAYRTDSKLIQIELRKMDDISNSFLDFCYIASFYISIADKDRTFLKELIPALNRRQKVALFHFFHLYGHDVYQQLNKIAQLEIDRDLYRYADITKGKEELNWDQNQDVPNCYIVTDGTISKFIDSFKAQVLPMALSKQFPSEDEAVTGSKFKKRYLVISSLSIFISSIVNRLEKVKYHLFSPPDFEGLIRKFTSEAMDELVARDGFKDRERLPYEIIIRDDIRNDWESSIDAFQSQASSNILKTSSFNYSTVLEVKGVVNEICYEPPHILDFFS